MAAVARIACQEYTDGSNEESFEEVGLNSVDRELEKDEVCQIDIKLHLADPQP